MDIDDFGNLCMGCMQDKGNHQVCPKCGYQMDRRRNPAALPYQAILHNKFLVGRILGQPGGFGVTYLAWDLVLHTTVAIKEYLPRDLATRDANQLTVVPYSHDSESLQEYHHGLRQFLNEARTLCRFSHPNVVRVREFFEQNNTAYIAMDYCEGVSLDEYLKRHGGVLGESAALALLMPILDGLREVHAKGFLHRDIKPANIYLTKSGTPIILDFGATRLALHGQRSRPLSVIFTPGFAPFEQYLEQTEFGPTLDIYSLGATLYYLVTGTIPQAAIGRVQKDEVLPPERLAPALSARTSQAIMQALALKPEQRPQDIDALWALLFPAEEPAEPGTRPLPQPATVVQPPPRGPQLRCVHCKASNPVPPGADPGRLHCVRCGKRVTQPQSRPAGLWWLAGVALLGAGLALPWRAEQPAPKAAVPSQAPAPVEPEPPQAPPTVELYTPQPLGQDGVGTAARRPPPEAPPPRAEAEQAPDGEMPAPARETPMPTQEAARPGRRPGYPPPQFAIDECRGRQAGATCTIALPDGRSETGSCRQVHEYFACVPAGLPLPPP